MLAGSDAVLLAGSDAVLQVTLAVFKFFCGSDAVPRNCLSLFPGIAFLNRYVSLWT